MQGFLFVLTGDKVLSRKETGGEYLVQMALEDHFSSDRLKSEERVHTRPASLSFLVGLSIISLLTHLQIVRVYSAVFNVGLRVQLAS